MSDAGALLGGRYRLVGPVGSGGFATVYRATDERLDATVAVKVLAENHALDPDIRERFITEAQLLRRVSSPAVVEIHDLGETDRAQPFIVMPFADGGDLRARVDAVGRAAATADVGGVVDVLATGLGALHAAGVVHRDVKPDNLLLSGSSPSTPSTPPSSDRLIGDGERLRLSDLGYAKDLDRSSGLTVGGGTVGFNAPEQRLGATHIDQRADVFGATAVVFWLLTGEAPSGDAAERERQLGAVGVERALAGVIERGLASKPDRRPPTIEAWHAELAVVLPAPAAGRERPAPANRSQRSLRRFAAGAIVAVIAVIAAATLGWLVGSGGDGDGGSITLSEESDGMSRTELRDGDIVAAIVGPARIDVDETATYRAAIDGAASYSWIAPDGRPLAGTPVIQVTATAVGSGTITLIVRDTVGRTLSLDFEFAAEDPAGG